jgi:hypothetical protein
MSQPENHELKSINTPKRSVGQVGWEDKEDKGAAATFLPAQGKECSPVKQCRLNSRGDIR